MPDDGALVPAGVLREMADRMEALADTDSGLQLGAEALNMRSSCYRRSASALRNIVNDRAVSLLGFVVARREGGRLVDDYDGEIHETREAGQRSLEQSRVGGHLGYGLYALTEVPYA